MYASLLIPDAHPLELFGECHLLLLGLLGVRGHNRLDFGPLRLFGKALSLLGLRIIALDLPLLGLRFRFFLQGNLVLVLSPAFGERVFL